MPRGSGGGKDGRKDGWRKGRKRKGGEEGWTGRAGKRAEQETGREGRQRRRSEEQNTPHRLLLGLPRQRDVPVLDGPAACKQMFSAASQQRTSEVFWGQCYRAGFRGERWEAEISDSLDGCHCLCLWHPLLSVEQLCMEPMPVHAYLPAVGRVGM